MVKSATIPPSDVLPFSRFSTWQRARNVVAYVLRFANNARRSRTNRVAGELTASELRDAECCLLQHAQAVAFPEEMTKLTSNQKVNRSSRIWNLSPYIADDGFMRISGRLEHSKSLAFEGKHPVIVPRGHLARLLVNFIHITNKHAGVPALMAIVRASYWVIGLRSLAKSVKRDCIRCQRFDNHACDCPSAPLPAVRVSEAPPFTTVGIDFAGPLFCADLPRTKLYVLLFTCAVVRAIHLELTDSLSLEDFLLAFRRFSARRGMPSTIYSDNATTFKGADVRLRRLYGPAAPDWRFIVPGSPWWGGWWERLVGSTKSALRKSVGHSSLTRLELETVLTECESCINCRPLTYAGPEESVLTPSHFLLGRMASIKVHPLDEKLLNPISTDDLISLNEAQQERLTEFWRKWSDTYLKGLPHVVSRFKKHGTLKVGSIVMVREDGLPKLKWPLGIVEEVFPGRDGLVRALRIRMAKGSFLKPIQKLYCLEMPLHAPDVSDSAPPSRADSPIQGESHSPVQGPPPRRSARAVRPPKIFDL